MRTSFLLLLVLLVCPAPASAQISYGVKGGVNLANLAFDGEGDVASSGRPGPLVGLFAVVTVGPLTVQPEAIYTVKGASIEVDGVESDYVVDYLEVPLLARVNVTRRLAVLAGPAFSMRLRARQRISFGASTEEIDVGDDVEPFDVGLVAGAAVSFGRWFVDGRYTHGLSDADADAGDTVQIRNRVVSVAAGIRF